VRHACTINLIARNAHFKPIDYLYPIRIQHAYVYQDILTMALLFVKVDKYLF